MSELGVKIVLKFVSEDVGEMVEFSVLDPRGTPYIVCIPHQTWKRFGEPKYLTVGISSGRHVLEPAYE